MLDRVMNMQDPRSFQEVSQELLNKEARASLRNEMANSEIVLRAEDLWQAERLDRARYDLSQLRVAFLETNEEEDGPKLLHRLQLLCVLNPGLTESIAVLLEQTCL